MMTSLHLNLLWNYIDITRVPFSDRGSRLLVFQSSGQSLLFVKLAERLTELQPDIEAYLRRPPFIRDLCLVDEESKVLGFEVVTIPICWNYAPGWATFNWFSRIDERLRSAYLPK